MRKWRRRVAEHRLEAVIGRILESRPTDGIHRSSRGKAEASGPPAGTVRRIWWVFGLQLHRVETLELPTGPDVVAEDGDVVGRHLAVPKRALAPCPDGNGRLQARARTQVR